MLLRALFDSRFRRYATPSLITWIYRGCLALVVLATGWWVLVALIIMQWRNGWFWGVLLLVVAPVVGIVLLLCVRVALELVAVRFRAVEPPRPEDGEPDASPVGDAVPLVSRTGEAARSVLRSLRTQGDEPVMQPERPDPPSGPAPDTGDLTARGEGLTARHVRIAGAVSAVVLVLLLAVAVAVTSGGGGGGPDKAAAGPASTTKVTPSAIAPPPASSAAPSSSPSSTPTTTPTTAPSVVWKGALSVNGPAVMRDLDAVPPRQDPDEADLTADWLETILKSKGDAQLAVVKGHPGAAECRDAAAADGSDEAGPLDEGDVVCVATTGGHVARLTTVEAHQTATAPVLRFSAVIWQVGSGQ